MQFVWIIFFNYLLYLSCYTKFDTFWIFESSKKQGLIGNGPGQQMYQYGLMKECHVVYKRRFRCAWNILTSPRKKELKKRENALRDPVRKQSRALAETNFESK